MYHINVVENYIMYVNFTSPFFNTKCIKTITLLLTITITLMLQISNIKRYVDDKRVIYF